MKIKKLIADVFFLISFFLLIIYFYFNVLEEDYTETNIDNNYYSFIEIPKIDLKKELYELNSKENNVRKNIQIIYPSEMPDIKNGNLILASHSGNGDYSFFRNLDKLEYDDLINIYYDKLIYSYKVVNIYKVEKLGYVYIRRNKNINTLTLITCDKKDKRKQIVFIAELFDINNNYI